MTRPAARSLRWHSSISPRWYRDVYSGGNRGGYLDFSLFGWEWAGIVPDAISLLLLWGASNFARVSNPCLDELNEQGRSIVHPENRQPIYNENQEIFVVKVSL